MIGKVLFASYGTISVGSSPWPCSAYKITTPYCHSSKSVSVVTSACIGKKKCSVNAGNALFDDPCSSTSKRLGIVVQCTEPNIAAFELIKARVAELTSGSVTQLSDILSTPIAKSPQGTMFYRWISSSGQSVIANLALSKAFITKNGFHTFYWDNSRRADLGLPLSDEYVAQINGQTGAQQDFELGSMYWTASDGVTVSLSNSASSPSTCSSGQTYNCRDCASCTALGYGYWSSSSASNPSAIYSSNTVGQCHSSYDSAPCNSFVFSVCTSSSTSQSYRTCPSSSFSSAGIYGGIAVAVLFWIINIILVASVARRKGLNPGLYVILAAFFSVFAWLFLCCGSNRSDGQALIGRKGAELKTMNVQAYSATPSGSSASGFHAQPSVPDPYVANAVPNPYAANAVPNPYAANAVPNAYSQSPAAAPYANAVSNAYNPHNSGAASAPSHDQPHAAAFHSSDAPTPSPQPAAYDQYSGNVQFLHTEASAESSQNLPAIMPAIMPY